MFSAKIKTQEFVAVAAKIIKERTGKGATLSIQDLADQVGMKYGTFSRWVEGKRPYHADKLALLCKALDDYRLLDWLESEVGRVAYRLPVLEGPIEVEDMRAIHRFVEKVGTALEGLGETLEKQRTAEKNVPETITKLDDVMRECLWLKRWLIERELAQKGKTKSRSDHV